MKNRVKIERLVDLALAVPRERWSDLLDLACEGQPEVRREVSSLLLHFDPESEFLSVPLVQRRDWAKGGSVTKGGVPDAAETHTSGVPTQVGPYRVGPLLGFGGMAVVYQARHPALEAPVALKLLCPGPITPDLERRFRNEAILMRRLNHPGIVQIFESGVEEIPAPEGGTHRQPYIAMELIHGNRLDRYIAMTCPPLDARLRLFVAICEAVQHAHRHGVIHRDLKPANVLVETSGRPKVLDFGIARAFGTEWTSATPLTGAGQILGSLAYMSPEQLSGGHQTVDERTDVYSLGVLLYELLSDRRPFDLTHLSVGEAAAVVATAEPSRLQIFDGSQQDALSRTVQRALSKDRDQRHSSASELGADVARTLFPESVRDQANTATRSKT